MEALKQVQTKEGGERVSRAILVARYPEAETKRGVGEQERSGNEVREKTEQQHKGNQRAGEVERAGEKGWKRGGKRKGKCPKWGSFCLLGIAFHWAEPADRSVEDEIPDDKVELLLIQGWRTDTEGDFLGIVFGEVRNDHLGSITDELLVFLTQVLDNRPLEILSHCDERPGTAMLTRTLEPHLLWSTCMEVEEGSYYVPSPGVYLHVDVTDLSTWDPLIRHTPARETSEEEEEEDEEEVSAEEEDQESDPDYQGSEDAESEEASSGQVESEKEEGGAGESSGLDELSREEREAVAQRRRAAAEEKRPIEESKGLPQLLQDDPTRNPEPPQEEDERDANATTEGSRSRRHQSPSQSSPV
ncbi:hypothetical protein CBR_g6702 [Chara braunii]|uniref:Uncharacterized protein n=1 Tax=Chara braunii TaxID=69332 RepID=A0A388KKI6_CHABU|nr:hypothetical protein CBR_g6702 [Chara braunii]|eukprot:GBG70575.1 hypothetical protein CBR_g6702 [Chara braunii]